jgi:hypothetical protein
LDDQYRNLVFKQQNKLLVEGWSKKNLGLWRKIKISSLSLFFSFYFIWVDWVNKKTNTVILCAGERTY